MPEESRRVLEGHGEVPLIRRRVEAPPATVRTLREVQGDNIGAAGLLWNERGQVLLVRHEPPSQWGDQWVAPGGGARPGESPEDTFLREVREETELQARILDLTCVYELTVTDGKDRVTGLFFQFEAMAQGSKAFPGPGIDVVRWFDDLPLNMAFRDDYLKVFQSRREEVLRLGKGP
ncbi:MAG: NUDIX hydrolase [Thermoplasmata archaeon]